MPILAVYSGLLAALNALASAHADSSVGAQLPLDYVRYPYQATYQGENGGKSPHQSIWRHPVDVEFLVTADSVFSGITTFAKLPWVQCLGKDSDAAFDIAFLGAPFVATVSSVHMLIASTHRKA